MSRALLTVAGLGLVTQTMHRAKTRVQKISIIFKFFGAYIML